MGDIILTLFIGVCLVAIIILCLGFISAGMIANRRARSFELSQEGIVVPEEVRLIDCRGEVKRIQSDAFEHRWHNDSLKIPREIVKPEYMYAEHPSIWLEYYVRFLRYIDCRLLIVCRKDYDKVRKYAESLEKGTAILLFLVLTSPAVAYFAAAGFSNPDIQIVLKDNFDYIWLYCDPRPLASK